MDKTQFVAFLTALYFGCLVSKYITYDYGESSLDDEHESNKTKSERPSKKGNKGASFEWGTWSAWSKCSVTCGKGIRVRTRPCASTDSNVTVETHMCGSHFLQDDVCSKRHCFEDNTDTINQPPFDEEILSEYDVTVDNEQASYQSIFHNNFYHGDENGRNEARYDNKNSYHSNSYRKNLEGEPLRATSRKNEQADNGNNQENGHDSEQREKQTGGKYEETHQGSSRDKNQDYIADLEDSGDDFETNQEKQYKDWASYRRQSRCYNDRNNNNDDEAEASSGGEDQDHTGDKPHRQDEYYEDRDDNYDDIDDDDVDDDIDTDGDNERQQNENNQDDDDADNGDEEKKDGDTAGAEADHDDDVDDDDTDHNDDDGSNGDDDDKRKKHFEEDDDDDDNEEDDKEDEDIYRKRKKKKRKKKKQKKKDKPDDDSKVDKDI